jgi:hypothetical protein
MKYGKNLSFLPEEWVRQHVVQFFIRRKKLPNLLINVEKIINQPDWNDTMLLFFILNNLSISTSRWKAK